MSFTGQYRIAAVVPKLHLADPEANAKAIFNLYEKATRKGAAIVCFPELALTGASCGDLFRQTHLQQAVQTQLLWLIKKTAGNSSALVVGLPLDGLNCVAVIQNGQLCGIVRKNALSAQEQRFFVSAQEETPPVFQAGALSFAILHGKDAFLHAPTLATEGACLLIHLSAELETVGRQEERRRMIQAQSARLHTMSLFLPSSGMESVADGLYGGAPLMAVDGRIIAEGERFARKDQVLYGDFVPAWLSARRKNWHLSQPENTVVVAPLPEVKNDIPALKIPKLPFVPETGDFSDEILAIQANALANRVEHTQAKRLVLGLSGGLDSTLALLVCVRCCDILKKKHDFILAVTMPGMGTTGRTKGNATQLAKQLGTELREINIRASVRQHFKDIDHDEANHNVVYENAQARERTQILLDLANKFNGLVVGTGDLSEIALGWCTFNGDHIAQYGVNGSIPKSLMRTIIAWVGQEKLPKVKAILQDIIDTPVSPELLPADEQGKIKQKTEEILGPYEIHDFFLYYFFKYGASPKKILFLAEQVFGKEFTKEQLKGYLKNFLRRFVTQQFKRNCMPDGVKATEISLSPRGGLAMPSDASFDVWMKDMDD